MFDYKDLILLALGGELVEISRHSMSLRASGRPVMSKSYRPFVLSSAAVLLIASGCAEEPAREPALVDPEGAYEEGPPLVVGDGKSDSVREVPAYYPLPDGAQIDAPFQVLFAPDDPVTTTELELIDEVIVARALDERVYEEGSNPFRIRYAVYNLRNPVIVDRLIEAEHAGVDVQILIEEGQLDPKKTWNTADEAIVEAGLELVKDSRDLTASQRDSADMIGIDRSGLMHLKTRLFEHPGSRALLTGSINPGDNAVLNEETLHLIRDERIVAKYADAYERVASGSNFANEWDEQAGINAIFTPASSGPRAVEKVFDWLEEEREQILLMVFSMRDISAPGHTDSLVELLVKKARAGVPVYVITDRKQSDGVDAQGNKLWFNDRTEDRLRAGGVHVYEAVNTAGPFNAMHHKVGVLGRTNIRVITDAANWTKAGLGDSRRKAKNVESQLFIDSARLGDSTVGERYLAQWLRVLDRYAGQEANVDEPTAEEARAELMAAPGWPMLGVTFDAQVETRFGESVLVRGSHEALGSWGRGHDGAALTTDQATYPMWTSVDEVLLPLGSSFEWKLVVSGDGGVRWENRSNRVGEVALPALLTHDTSHHTATWR